MVDGTGGQDNGRVTLALLGYKMDQLTQMVREHNEREIKLEDRMGRLERDSERKDERLKNVEDDVKGHGANIDDLKSSDRKWGIATGFFSVIAAGLISFFKQ